MSLSNDFNTINVPCVFDRIGPIGTDCSDDRITRMLLGMGNVKEIFTDCPLSVPPCVACTRNVCPGLNYCDDKEIAYMQMLNRQISAFSEKKAKRINPQTQRFWDIYSSYKNGGRRFEPSYSSNQAMLAVRASVLKKRLTSVDQSWILKETSFLHASEALTSIFDFDATIDDFKDFEDGPYFRNLFFNKIKSLGILDRELKCSVEYEKKITSNIATFQAFICSLVGVYFNFNKTDKMPINVDESMPWVYVPSQAPDNL